MIYNLNVLNVLLIRIRMLKNWFILAVENLSYIFYLLLDFKYYY